MDIQTAPVIRGKHNETFYVRGVDAKGNVTYTSEYGSEQNWVAHALTARPDDWETSSHLSMVAKRY